MKILCSFSFHLSSPFLRVIRVHRKPEESEHQQLQSASALRPQHPPHGRWASRFINVPCCASFINPLSQSSLRKSKYSQSSTLLFHEHYFVSIQTITSLVSQSKSYVEESKTFLCEVETLYRSFNALASRKLYKKKTFIRLAFALRVQNFWMV